MIHMLLHIADSIEAQGPLWVYWSFVMERHCGLLGRVLRSRQQPMWMMLHCGTLPTGHHRALAQTRLVNCSAGIKSLRSTNICASNSQTPLRPLRSGAR